MSPWCCGDQNLASTCPSVSKEALWERATATGCCSSPGSSALSVTRHAENRRHAGSVTAGRAEMVAVGKQRARPVSPERFSAAQRMLTGFKQGFCSSVVERAQKGSETISAPIWDMDTFCLQIRLAAVCCASSLPLFTLSWCEVREELFSLAKAKRRKQTTEVQISHI